MVKPFSFGNENQTKKRKKRSTKQEEALAEKVGGKAQAGSGNQWHSLGDVRDSEFLFECKYTQKEFYTISKKLWDEIETKAFKEGGRTPALEILLAEGKLYKEETMYVLSQNDFDALLEENPVPINRAVQVTDNKSFRFKLNLWHDFAHESMEQGKHPALLVQLMNGTKDELRLVIMSEELFFEIRDL